MYSIKSQKGLPMVGSSVRRGMQSSKWKDGQHNHSASKVTLIDKSPLDLVILIDVKSKANW